jgi:hypothetical protein
MLTHSVIQLWPLFTTLAQAVTLGLASLERSKLHPVYVALFQASIPLPITTHSAMKWDDNKQNTSFLNSSVITL